MINVVDIGGELLSSKGTGEDSGIERMIGNGTVVYNASFEIQSISKEGVAKIKIIQKEGYRADIANVLKEVSL